MAPHQRNGRRNHVHPMLVVHACVTCKAILDARKGLPSLCPHCGGDPVHGPQATAARNQEQDIAAWLAGS